MHLILLAIAAIAISIFGHTILTFLWVIIAGVISGIISALPVIICLVVGLLVLSQFC